MATTSRAEQFISIFNNIEKELRKRIHNSEKKSFSQLVDAIKDKNTAIPYFSSKLKRFADLRNVIVHDSVTEQFIAEPNEEAILEFKSIYEYIIRPPQIYPSIIGHKPLLLHPNDPLSKALMFLEEMKFSQIPVYDEKSYVGMFRASIVSHWLTKSIDQDIVSILDTNVHDIINLDDNERIELFKSRDLNIFELLEIFQSNSSSDKKVDAIIITTNGKRNEQPLTIVTEWDLPKILKARI